MNIQSQPVTASNASGRMQHIDVAGAIRLGMERPLHHERARVPAFDQAGAPVTLGKTKIELCKPGRLRGCRNFRQLSFDFLRGVQHGRAAILATSQELCGVEPSGAMISAARG